ncbi:MAG: VOC family protein [Blastomonas fulva]|jgi:catechol 2,3-dioxygenase-like lactoylglutathione lyase family enzyme|uniref:VOC family protein n=1 Tax=Blastomonas TaxID=150203 RepID=UPI00083DA40C|nr:MULTISPECIES: VOC family protein [Blastomonas]AOG02094.1 glyoxalase-like domain protein [Blastomonas sp. RAC04]MCO5793825.1 VOC family protein [Blastomonas sp.]MDM7929411.1 VOC family protein [Blastomonas fulva]MDM7965372.1 VOC family protein [Blastomonas fulva]
MLSVARYGTRDLARATEFYDVIAALLGARRVMERDELVAYKGADGGMFLIGLPFAGEASVGNGSQVGFSAPSRDIVDAVHAEAIALGGTCEGTPGVRGPDGPNGFYAAYFRDRDGNKIMVMRVGP